MTNIKLIESAIVLANKYFEYNNISMSTQVIQKRAEYWYNHTDIVDTEILAAMIINGEYHTGYSYDEILAIKEYYFPTVPFEFSYPHIGEIEKSLHDMLWRQ